MDEPQTFDYSIYKISCNDETVLPCYYGSTSDFHERKSSHKRSTENETHNDYNFKKSAFIRENGGWDNWTMDVIETIKCCKHDAWRLEKKYIEFDNNSTLNVLSPILSEEEKIQKKQAHSKRYRMNNLEKLKDYNTQYYIENKEHMKQHGKEHYAKNSESLRKWQLEYHMKNRVDILQKQKEYTLKNKEKIKRQQSTVVLCGNCSGMIRIAGKAEHQKSLKCMSFKKV